MSKVGKTARTGSVTRGKNAQPPERVKKLSAMEKQAICTPWNVAKALGIALYPWQKDVLFDAAMPGNVALRAANESGKTTAIAAVLILWHALAFKQSTTVLTSGSWNQVLNQLMPAILRHAHLLPGWSFTRDGFTAPNGSRLCAFSTNDAQKFEGWHALDAALSPLLIIVDEAKGVSDAIYSAVERCGPQRLLIMSSPGLPQGFFYRAFTEWEALFARHIVTAEMCPHLPAERNEAIRAKYGAEHPLVKSMLNAEWMTDDGDKHFVISWAMLEKLGRQKLVPVPGERRAFCDFAVSAMGDENVLAFRDGNQVELLEVWTGDGDTLRTAYRFVEAFKKHGLVAGEIYGDAGGIGAGIIDILHNMGWPIQRVNNGAKAKDDTRYCNVGAEMWFEARELLDKSPLILPDDEVLRKQLTSREWDVDVKGRLKLSSKQEMAGSPDRADAVVGVLYRHASTQPIDFMRGTHHHDIFTMKQKTDEPEGALPGAYAGW